MSPGRVSALEEWRAATRCVGRVVQLRERAERSRWRRSADAARIARLESIEVRLREFEATARERYHRLQQETIEEAREDLP